MANNFRPLVDALDKKVEVGRAIVVSTMFDYLDLDDNPLRQLRVTDLGGAGQSGYFVYRGDRLNANQTYTFNANQLRHVRYYGGLLPGQELFRVQAYDGRFWSEAESATVSTVQPNRRPVLRFVNRFRGLSSETYDVDRLVTVRDADRDNIVRYRLRYLGNAAGYFQLGNQVIRGGRWFNVNQANLEKLEFVAHDFGGRDRRATFQGYAFDGRVWSKMDSQNYFFESNASRPIVNAKNLELAIGSSTLASNLFNLRDRDGNTVKKYSFFDTGVQNEGGYFSFKGNRVAPRKWFTVHAADLDHVRYHSASTFDVEVLRVRANDGRFWSRVASSRAETYQVPVVTVDDTVIMEDLQEVALSSLFRQVDQGPQIRKYRIFDANTSNLSARLYDANGNRMAQGRVIELTAAEFNQTILKGGHPDDRALDEFYIRAYNGSEWADWERMNVYTEPNHLDALLSGRTWNESLGQARQLTYTFLQTVPFYYPDDAPEREGFSRFTAEQRLGARRGMQMWANLTGLSFRETTQEDDLGHITYGNTTVDDGVAAYAYLPSSIGPAPPGDVWLGENVATNFDQTPGGFGYLTMLHEQGHAFGFQHPFDDGGGSSPPWLPEATDNHRFSVMSYSNPPGIPSSVNARTPMLYDVYAMQRIYGANMNYNRGRTGYTWARNESFMETIWDGGGIDVISAANQTAPQVIDLREGRFSSIGNLEQNVAIAFGTIIENARGGRNRDELYGNEVNNWLTGGEGNDHLRGFGGNDTLRGGPGNDFYYWSVGDGNDRIREQGGGGHDVLQLEIQGNMYTKFRNDPLETSILFRRRGSHLEVQLDFDGDRGRATLRIENQRQQNSAVETLRLYSDGEKVEQNVDLTSVYQLANNRFQHFTLTDFRSSYGFIATPV